MEKKYTCEKCEIEFNHQSSLCRHKKKCQPNENQKPSKLEIENKLMESKIELLQTKNKLIETELNLLQIKNELIKEKNNYKEMCKIHEDTHEMMRVWIRELVTEIKNRNEIAKESRI